jgi:general secretion pathway protein G
MNPRIARKVYPRGRAAGFTLIEIMVVVVILGILAAIVVPKIMDAPGKARIARAKSDIANIKSALDLYKLDNFNYPSTQQGLVALVAPPQGDPPARNWKPGGYIEHLPKDPWGNPYQYLNPGAHGEIDIFTLGADNAPGGDGENADIGSWNLGD